MSHSWLNPWKKNHGWLQRAHYKLCTDLHPTPTLFKGQLYSIRLDRTKLQHWSLFDTNLLTYSQKLCWPC